MIKSLKEKLIAEESRFVSELASQREMLERMLRQRGVELNQSLAESNQEKEALNSNLTSARDELSNEAKQLSLCKEAARNMRDQSNSAIRRTVRRWSWLSISLSK